MSLIKKSHGVTIGTWNRSDPTDIIGIKVGGNRYGWFVQNEIDELAIDNSERTGSSARRAARSRSATAAGSRRSNTDQATFGGNAKVSATGETSGNQTITTTAPSSRSTSRR